MKERRGLEKGSRKGWEIKKLSEFWVRVFLIFFKKKGKKSSKEKEERKGGLEGGKRRSKLV